MRSQENGTGQHEVTSSLADFASSLADFAVSENMLAFDSDICETADDRNLLAALSAGLNSWSELSAEVPDGVRIGLHPDQTHAI